MDMKTVQHPKQLEHTARRAAMKARQQARNKMTHDIVDANHLRFVHVRNINREWAPLPKGGITVAYQLPKHKGDRLVKVSCSIVHDNDSYCKAEGRYQVARKFIAGEAISVRVPKNMSVPLFVKRMFGQML